MVEVGRQIRGVHTNYMWLEQISDHIHESICEYVTCAISGTH